MSDISVIGLGKLGAPLAAVLSSKGHKVIGVDLNETTVSKINHGTTPVQEPGLQELITKFPFEATDSYELAVSRTNISLIIVPTPSDSRGAFSNNFVLDSIRRIGSAVTSEYHLVVVCSTVMPGSMDGPIWVALQESSGRDIGNNIGLCYSPEFIALGSVIENMLNPDMVLVGESDHQAGDRLVEVLETVSSAPICRMSLIDSEIAKISVNTFITMKISYANQLAEICEALPGADANAVVDAIGLDTRIGRKYLAPGTAYGGPCFPRDTRAFTQLGSDIGVSCDLAVAAQTINDRQTDRLVDFAKTVLSKKVGILGLTYKPDTPVIDDSPGVNLGFRLLEEGFTVAVYDPLVKQSTIDWSANYCGSVDEVLRQSDIVFIMTPDEQFKNIFPKSFDLCPSLFIVDCWNLIESGPWDEVNVVKIGVW